MRLSENPTSGTPVDNSSQTLAFRLIGRVGSDDFAGWIERHARKLGVEFKMEQNMPGIVSIEAAGAAEMLDAFALACSLGPRSVCVETLEILEPTRRDQ